MVSTSIAWAPNAECSITNLLKRAAIHGAATICLVFAGCGGGSSYFPTAPPDSASIASFAPVRGTTGTHVTITGTNLAFATAVTFNGIPAPVISSNQSTVETTVPNGATTGKISVTSPLGTAVSASEFRVLFPPTINSFSPNAGVVGTTVRILGSHFAGCIGASLNGAAIEFHLISDGEISVVIPQNAVTGRLSISTPDGSVTSAHDFWVTQVAGLDLAIDGIMVTQGTQSYPVPDVPLLQGRSTWIRVFAKATQANQVAPRVRVDLTDGNETATLMIDPPANYVPEVADADTNVSWNAPIPTAWIRPGVQVRAELDPDGSVQETSKANNTFSTVLNDVRSLPPWKVTIIPIQPAGGSVPVVETDNWSLQDWLNLPRRWFPVSDDIDLVVGSTMQTQITTNVYSSQMLSELMAKRTAEGVSDRFYLGMINGSAFGDSGVSFLDEPVAIGCDTHFLAYCSLVFVHEIGHGLGRRHTPACMAYGPDPNYPYPDSKIGVPGWDVFASSDWLKPSSYLDYMGYCPGPMWTSDYNYNGILEYREKQLQAAKPIASGQTVEVQGLLVWGRIENDSITLEPAFRVPLKGTIRSDPGPYTWEAIDGVGRVVARRTFAGIQVEHDSESSASVFSFIVPIDQSALDEVRTVRVLKDEKQLASVTRPEARLRSLQPESSVTSKSLANDAVALSWDVDRVSMLMLRDPETGEVLGFLRRPGEVRNLPADVEVHLSDGIESQRVPSL